jgi:hypothetical protein
MGTREKQEHQPEPWMQDGRYIQDASGWTLASARFPGDARRIIAAINAVQGIPTDALESWVVNVVAETAGRVGSDRRTAGGAAEPAPNERRVAERRRGDRRSSRPELRVFGSTPVYQEDDTGKDSQ